MTQLHPLYNLAVSILATVPSARYSYLRFLKKTKLKTVGSHTQAASIAPSVVNHTEGQHSLLAKVSFVNVLLDAFPMEMMPGR